MTHEGDDTLGSLCLVELVELLSHFGNVALSILEQGHAELERHAREVAVVEVAVRVVGEVLDIVDHAGVLLAGDDLQRLYDDLRIAHVFVCEGVEPEVRSIVVAADAILTGSSAVDTDGRRVREEYVIVFEGILVGCDGAVEGVESLLPCRTEGDEEDDLVVLLVGLYVGCHQRLIAGPVGLVDNGHGVGFGHDFLDDLLVVVASHERQRSECCHSGKHHKLNLLHCF